MIWNSTQASMRIRIDEKKLKELEENRGAIKEINQYTYPYKQTSNFSYPYNKTK